MLQVQRMPSVSCSQQSPDPFPHVYLGIATRLGLEICAFSQYNVWPWIRPPQLHNFITKPRAKLHSKQGSKVPFIIGLAIGRDTGGT